MAVFSVNQATQMYVGSNITTELLGGVDTYYLIDGKERTDVIKAGHVLYETTTTIGDLNAKAMVATLTVGTVAKGDEYLVRLTITEDAGVANAYIKSVGVVASSTTNTDLAGAIRKALQKAADRDAEALYAVGGTGAAVTITPNLINSVGKKFYIPQVKVEVVNLHKDDDTLLINDPKNGWVKYAPSPIAGSGLAKLQELEYFCAGEKGDTYRGAAWPNDIKFESKLAKKGDDTVVTILHYYEDASNEAVQKSEKTIVLVGTISAPTENESKTPIYDAE